jgi:aquaporin Z
MADVPQVTDVRRMYFGPGKNARLNHRDREVQESPIHKHWPEYLIEGALLGCFMLSISILVTVFESSSSIVIARIPGAVPRFWLLAISIGAALGLLIQSPWGKRSGAHMNPAITLAFLRLRKMQPLDAFFYVVAQTLGGTLGVIIAALTMGKLFTAPPVQYAATLPGPGGEITAFVAETLISFLLMATILFFISTARLARFTALAIGVLVTALIMIEAPLSGTSMNPARTLASAIPGMMWQHLWLYLAGPTLGMMLAAQVHRVVSKNPASGCAKLLHPRKVRCIHCGYLCD